MQAHRRDRPISHREAWERLDQDVEWSLLAKVRVSRFADGVLLFGDTELLPGYAEIGTFPGPAESLGATQTQPRQSVPEGKRPAEYIECKYEGDKD